jgi:hypothetical protein
MQAAAGARRGAAETGELSRPNQCVELLLRCCPPVDHQGGLYGSALWAAAVSRDAATWYLLAEVQSPVHRRAQL